MKIIGLCGGSGSGKGTVSNLFLEYGIPSIDTDEVYREITSYKSKCMDELVSAFGDSVMNPDGSLNRTEMRNIAFMSDGKNANLELLNAITHKYVLDETVRRINVYKNQGLKAVIADVPLLFESGFDQHCDVTIAVIADEDKRTDRIMRRDHLSYEHAKNRIKSQISNDEISSRVDFFIENNGDLEDLKKEVSKLYNKLI